MSTVLESKPQRTTSVELEALRSIKYDWAMHLRSVWSDPPYDSVEIHTSLRQEFQDRLDEFKAENSVDSPLGWLVVGPAGTGKTHWLSICRQQAIAREYSFVLVDMVGVRGFWDTVLQGYLDSLQQEILDGKSQQQILTERFLRKVGLLESVDSALAKLRDNAPEKLAHNIDKVLDKIYRSKRESLQYQDVIRAILAMVSHDVNVMSAGLSWLTANPVDEDCRKMLGFAKAQEEPHQIVKALSWMMSLCSPTVVAFDQLDPIVAQLDPAAKAEGRETGAEGRALSIIQEIANGLGEMRDVTFRTLTVVSCLEATLHALARHTVGAWRDRFLDDLFTLNGMSTAEAAASMLYPRVDAACRSVGFEPPTLVWPLAESALNEIKGQTPRELLKICESHRKQCLRSGTVTLLRTLKPAEDAPEHLPDVDSAMDEQFTRLREVADVRWLLEQSTEDERFAPLLLAGCRCLLREITLPDTVDPVVDDFPGGKVSKPLHARIRLIDHAANDREVHYCFRALERMNAVAFQARLKALTNGSGIDKKLPFRHSVILRTNPLPGGPITKMLLDKYAEYGGRWYKPTEEEVRTLYALKELLQANPLGLDDWLNARRPASKLQLFQTNCIQLFKPCVSAGRGVNEPPNNSSTPSFPRKAPSSDSTSSAAKKTPQPKKSDSPIVTAQIPLGQRPLGSKSETVWLPLQLLEKHTVVLAGAGAGKTVLLKRLIEEAALAGVPSIVLDGANDLASLGDKWPEAPNPWLPDDAEKARHFHANTDIVYWTPGRESGNHLVFEPLPDLAAVADAPEDLQLTIDAAVDGLAAMVISGRAGAENKRGILTQSLRFFAEHGGGNLRDFIALLCELPPEASLGINNEQKLAKVMADALTAKLVTNPMLRGVGTGLDPAVLFGDAKKLKAGPRISLISLIGLASEDLRQQFVYQLGMALFAWIKRNPNPPGRPLRGLLIVDEAKDFVPAIKSPPSKASLQLLASQARKYHLGLLLATQNPKEIENKVIGNCATQFYGKASSPNSRQVIQNEMHARGGRGDDIAALKAGQFYVYNSEASMSQPVKLTIPMCLSQHKTLDESEVLALAAKSRERLAQAK